MSLDPTLTPSTRKVLVNDSARKRVIAYLILTVALCAPFYYLIISAGTLRVAGGLYVLGIMWCPGIAGLLTRLWFQRNLRGVGWGWGKTRFQLWSYFIPVIAGLGAYGFAWTTGLGGFSAERLTSGVENAFGIQSATLPVAVAVMGTIGFFQSALSATGEELGWRGLLVPEMARMTGYTRLSLVSAAIWALYHFPLLIFADYNSTAPKWFALLFFTMNITAISFIFAWFRLRSGSVWTSVILHASHNLFIQSVFDRLTVDAGATEYVTTEFGAGLTVAYAVIAYWCWRHRDELQPQTA
jgi:CAAX protease family protein